MTSLAVGQTVQVPCEVQRGAFPTEMLVTVETSEGPISGFVRAENVVGVKGHDGFIVATVRDISSDIVTVVLSGSFFTTTGIAYLNRDWANSHLQMAHA